MKFSPALKIWVTLSHAAAASGGNISLFKTSSTRFIVFSTKEARSYLAK